MIKTNIPPSHPTRLLDIQVDILVRENSQQIWEGEKIGSKMGKGFPTTNRQGTMLAWCGENFGQMFTKVCVLYVTIASVAGCYTACFACKPDAIDGYKNSKKKSPIAAIIVLPESCYNRNNAYLHVSSYICCILKGKLGIGRNLGFPAEHVYRSEQI